MTEYYRLHVPLRADDPQDAVVIEALERLGERGKSRWVRRVLYEAITEPARADILAEIQGVRQAVERLEVGGVIIAQPTESESNAELEEAERNLDGLLDRLEEW